MAATRTLEQTIAAWEYGRRIARRNVVVVGIMWLAAVVWAAEWTHLNGPLLETVLAIPLKGTSLVWVWTTASNTWWIVAACVGVGWAMTWLGAILTPRQAERALAAPDPTATVPGPSLWCSSGWLLAVVAIAWFVITETLSAGFHVPGPVWALASLSPWLTLLAYMPVSLAYGAIMTRLGHPVGSPIAVKDDRFDTVVLVGLCVGAITWFVTLAINLVPGIWNAVTMFALLMVLPLTLAWFAGGPSRRAARVPTPPRRIRRRQGRPTRRP